MANISVVQVFKSDHSRKIGKLFSFKVTIIWKGLLSFSKFFEVSKWNTSYVLELLFWIVGVNKYVCVLKISFLCKIDLSPRGGDWDDSGLRSGSSTTPGGYCYYQSIKHLFLKKGTRRDTWFLLSIKEIRSVSLWFIRNSYLVTSTRKEVEDDNGNRHTTFVSDEENEIKRTN